MPQTLNEAAMNFMLEVLWQELEPQLRALGVRTDKAVEGPRMAGDGREHGIF
jgi:hypothetical protein